MSGNIRQVYRKGRVSKLRPDLDGYPERYNILKDESGKWFKNSPYNIQEIMYSIVGDVRHAIYTDKTINTRNNARNKIDEIMQIVLGLDNELERNSLAYTPSTDEINLSNECRKDKKSKYVPNNTNSKEHTFEGNPNHPNDRKSNRIYENGKYIVPREAMMDKSLTYIYHYCPGKSYGKWWDLEIGVDIPEKHNV